MKKPSTKMVRRTGKLLDQQLTVGLDLGDRSSFYCGLNEAGEVIRGSTIAPALRVTHFQIEVTSNLSQPAALFECIDTYLERQVEPVGVFSVGGRESCH